VILVIVRKGIDGGDSDWPFSIAVLAMVERRESRLNSVRHADGSPTTTCVFYAVRV